MPHGACYLWQPATLWLNVGADALIAGSYYAIPLVLFSLVRQRRAQLPYWWVPAMFAAFIFLCGTTHVFDIWTVWNPDYRVEGFIKLLTGAVSAATAVALVWIMPHLLALRSPAELQREVDERTAELLAANNQLREQNARSERMSEALRQSERQLRLITDNLPAAISYVDRDGIYRFCNAGYEQWTGQAPADIAGRHLRDVIGQDIYEHRQPYLNAVLSGELVHFEGPTMHDALGLRESAITYAPDVAADGAVNGFYVMAQDVTERKRAEQALKESDRRKDEFLATLAHELRNPLAPIDTAIKILRRRDVPEKVARTTREIMGRQVQHMVRLVDDLLEVSRITRGVIELRKEIVSIGFVVTSAVEAARPLIDEKGQELNVRLPVEPVQLEADPVRVSQVLINLLSNASKYTPRGGHISISAETEAADVVISVSDDGIGIPADSLESIFELFKRMDSAYRSSNEGLGIGLTLARELVRLHHGTIEVRSDGPGRGSTFLVRLPAEATAAKERSEPETHSAARVPPRRILVVDDSADAADSLAMKLELEGHVVRTVYSGAAAIDALEKFGPEVALLDIGMPGMDGYELARRIRASAEGAGMLLIAVTGWGQEEDKRRSAEAGFDAHLTKPVDSRLLSQLLIGGQ